MSIFYHIYRLCSHYEECDPGTSIPLRLIDIEIYYEDHCKKTNTLPQSKDYISKILPKVFQGAQRTCVNRNGKHYQGFMGIKEANGTSDLSSDAVATVHTDTSGNIAVAVPSWHQKNGNQLFVVATLREGYINLGLSDGITFEKMDNNLLDIPSRSTVSRPEKAFKQISRSIRVCRGFQAEEGTGDKWTTITNKAIEHRIRAPTCQNAVTWLSREELCGPCKRLRQKQTKDKPAEENGIKCSGTDSNLLETVLQKGAKDGTQASLLKAQLKNNDPKKDPRFRRWDHEVITLCLTLYCRYVIPLDGFHYDGTPV